jgi:hypothetical protein
MFVEILFWCLVLGAWCFVILCLVLLNLVLYLKFGLGCTTALHRGDAERRHREDGMLNIEYRISNNEL